MYEKTWPTSILIGVDESKRCFLKFCNKEIGNIKRTRFWEDLWVSDVPLRDKYARLYNLTFSPNINHGRCYI